MRIFSAFAVLILSGCAAQTPVRVAVNPTPAPQPTRAATPQPKPTAAPTRGEVRAVEFSPDLKWLATGTRRDTGGIDGIVTVREVATNRVVREWTLENGVKFLAFSPDGTMLAVTGASFALSIWNWRSGKMVHHETLKAGEGNADRVSIAFSPDGRTLAVGVAGGQLFDTSRWTHRAAQKQPRLYAYSQIIGDVRFSPDGRYLLESDDFEGDFGFTFVPLRGQSERDFSGFLSWSAPIFSRDGRLFAGSGDNLDRGDEAQHAAFGWNARNLKIRQTFKSEQFQPQAFSPDARFVAGLRVEGSDPVGPVEIWSVASGRRVRAFQQTARRVAWLNSKTLLLGDESGVRRLRVP